MVIRYGDIQPYKYGGQPLARRGGRCNVGYQAGGNIQGPPSGNEMERMHGIGLYDSRARWYDPALGRTTTMDSEAGTYPGISPHLWCAANPIRFTDPSGKKFLVVDRVAQDAIRNTVPKEERKYIQFKENGVIDRDVLFSHNSVSYNYLCIGEIECSQDVVTIEMNDHYFFRNSDGDILSSGKMTYSIDADLKDSEVSSAFSNTTGETGELGIALLPGSGKSGVNSIDDGIHIILNSNLSEEGAAANISHELFGHGLMYVRTHNRDLSGHIPSGLTDLNRELTTLIYNSLKETIDNIKNR